MKAILALSLAALSCTTLNKFTPATGEAYPPRSDDYAIELLQEAPARPHILIGYVEARGTAMDNALPLLLKQARLAGGSALLKVEVSQVLGMAQAYTAAVIRYTDEAPAR